MALLKKLKEKLGLGGDASERSGADTEVTVERESGDSAGEVDEPVATETDATASTESLVEEEAAADDPDEAAEPAEAAGPGTGEEEEPASREGESVEAIKGIGPAYAERLGEADIHTVADLAAADAADIAEKASVGEKRAERWIDRAKEF